MSESQEPQESAKADNSLIGELSIAKYTVDPEIVNRGLWGPSGKPSQGVLADNKVFSKDKKRIHEDKE